MTKNKKFLYLGLVVALAGIWLMIPAIATNTCPPILSMFALFGTPIGFVLMLIGIFMKEN